MESITEPPVEAPSTPTDNTRLEDIDMEELLGLDEMVKVPADSPSLSMEQSKNNEPIESIATNNLNIFPEHPNIEPIMSNTRDIINLKPGEEKDTSLIFGLNLNSVLNYILILVVILAILYITFGVLQKQ